ncbi:MAG: hypothetical protein GVY32_05555, partial [Gammaproteobacteria bacterium]|nr:hypothetical protein [Gammaproteobacteria bacterium]
MTTTHRNPFTRVGAAGDRALFCLVAIVLLSWCAVAAAENYAGRTPGNKHLSEAMDSYEAGQYGSALMKFKTAARWADKLAQFNVGVMYLNGQGTEADLARAWAWFELAAERNYPSMTETADRLWSMLDESQRVRARSILEDDLRDRFGDAVAVPRTATYMRRQQRSGTGSRLGFRSGNLRVIEVDDARWNRGSPQSSSGIIVTGRTYSGDEYYDPDKFDFYNVVAAESRLFEAEQRGQVTIGKFELLDEETDADQSTEGKRQ